MDRPKRARVRLTDDVADVIFRRLTNGEPLSSICGPDREPGLPDRYTVHRRSREDADFRLDYLRARQAQAETLADQILTIADGPPGEKPNVGRDRLRVHARQWLAGAMAPRIFGRHATLQKEIEALERQQARERAAEERRAERRAEVEGRAAMEAILREMRDPDGTGAGFEGEEAWEEGEA